MANDLSSYMLLQADGDQAASDGDQAAFHARRPEYVRRELGKIPWRTKECPPYLGVLVTENPLDR